MGICGRNMGRWFPVKISKSVVELIELFSAAVLATQNDEKYLGSSKQH